MAKSAESDEILTTEMQGERRMKNWVRCQIWLGAKDDIWTDESPGCLAQPWTATTGIDGKGMGARQSRLMSFLCGISFSCPHSLADLVDGNRLHGHESHTDSE
jgi:hypothetical protein